MLDRIEMSELDKFTSLYVDLLVAKFSFQTVRRVIVMDGGVDEIVNLITHIVEVGAVKIIAENYLLSHPSEGLVDSLFLKKVLGGVSSEEIETASIAAVLALNISLAAALRKRNLYTDSNCFYYSFDIVQILVSRVVNHLTPCIQFGAEILGELSNQMVKMYLTNKL